MSYVVNERHEVVFGTLNQLIESTKNSLRTTMSPFQNVGVVLTDKDLLEFEQNLDRLAVHVQRTVSQVKGEYRSALDIQKGGMYDLNRHLDVVNMTEEERMMGQGLTRTELLIKINNMLDLDDNLSESDKYKLLNIKKNLIATIKASQDNQSHNGSYHKGVQESYPRYDTHQD